MCVCVCVYARARVYVCAHQKRSQKNSDWLVREVSEGHRTGVEIVDLKHSINRGQRAGISLEFVPVDVYLGLVVVAFLHRHQVKTIKVYMTSILTKLVGVGRESMLSSAFNNRNLLFSFTLVLFSLEEEGLHCKHPSRLYDPHNTSDWNLFTGQDNDYNITRLNV